jgi:hypothetical protein
MVEGGNEGQFLQTVAGRTKAVMVTMKVVVVVGCSAASTACFLPKIGENIPDPPWGYSIVEYRGKIAVVRLSSNGKNNSKSDHGSKRKLDRTDMLTGGLAEPYCGLSTMVKEGGVPANFC